MDKKLRDTRDLLYTLLLALGEPGEEGPQIIDVSEFDDARKWFLLTSSCAEMIAYGIRIIAGSDRTNRLKGYEALTTSLKQRVMEDDDPRSQRPH